jgi:hypothetical protein
MACGPEEDKKAIFTAASTEAAGFLASLRGA